MLAGKLATPRVLGRGNIPSCCSSAQGVQHSGKTVTNDIVVVGNVHEITLEFRNDAHHDDAHEGNISGPVGVFRNNTASVFPSRCVDLFFDSERKVDIFQVIRDVGWVVPALIDNMGFVMSRLVRMWFGFLIIYGKEVLFPLGAESLYSS